MTQNIAPEDQFQVGDHVLLIHVGVITRIEGYLWSESIGSPPQIAAYRLTCGVNSPRAGISRWEGTRGSPIGGEAQAGGTQSPA